MNDLHPQMSDQQLYVATSGYDRTLQLAVRATSDSEAIVLALDTIGYSVVLAFNDDNYYLVDADDNSIVENALHTSDFEQALRVALKEINWTISEPQDLIGGLLGSGFGLEEQ